MENLSDQRITLEKFARKVAITTIKGKRNQSYLLIYCLSLLGVIVVRIISMPWNNLRSIKAINSSISYIYPTRNCLPFWPLVLFHSFQQRLSDFWCYVLPLNGLPCCKKYNNFSRLVRLILVIRPRHKHHYPHFVVHSLIQSDVHPVSCPECRDPLHYLHTHRGAGTVDAEGQVHLYTFISGRGSKRNTKRLFDWLNTKQRQQEGERDREAEYAPFC